MTKSIHDRINAGEFDNKEPRPRLKDFGFEKGYHRVAETAWYQRDKALRDSFFDAAEADLGTAGHPLSLRARRLAWQEGHSSGYSQVYYHLQTYAEEFLYPSEKPFKDAGLWGKLIAEG